MDKRFKKLHDFIRVIYAKPSGPIPLHEPYFLGNELKYVAEAIESRQVSAAGSFIDRFEQQLCQYTGAKYAVATSTGTAALHISLKLAGVEPGDEVITQALTYVATANAIRYCGAEPVYVDVDKDTLGLSPEKLEKFLVKNTIQKNGRCVNKLSNKTISAIVPMHTIGHPTRIIELVDVCDKFNIAVIEDAAESIGSFYKNQHTGTFGLLGIFSFNGNKTLTSGGGGAIVTNDEALAKKAKFLINVAKDQTTWEYQHDELGYNYQMPNINAALALAQLEQLNSFLENKKQLAAMYLRIGQDLNLQVMQEPKDSTSNFWLNGLILNSKHERDELLQYLNENEIMARPAWKLLYKLPMYSQCFHDEQINAEWLEERIVKLPSSIIP